MVGIVTPGAIGGSKSVGYGLDKRFVERWRAFVEALAADADAELPEH
jgi:hypothetical protein